ncbi:MAG TPA: DMT family transporter [Anaeromyxobacteraceae bacterium]|jgi:drug/metabolite transporter (DMT)-like permease|nr:DMT family transporter [Anaeromyxobacteraceae bacterium]
MSVVGAPIGAATGSEARRGPATPSRLRTAALTLATLVCFAANSLLCRAALRPRLVDAVTFTTVRLLSGAAALTLIVLARRRARPRGGSLGAGLTLLVYAVAFSLAYVRIGAGVGALLLFGAVQVTMLGWSLARGVRPGAIQWIGIAVALGGLAYLGLPGASAPDPAGALLMVVAGAAWGAYSLLGRAGGDVIATNADNFLRAAPFALALSLALYGRATATGEGLLLAAASGALASGAGYSLWYTVVPALGATRAAAVQLLVPVLAGLGATAFLGEALTARVATSGAAILAGIALTLRRR